MVLTYHSKTKNPPHETEGLSRNQELVRDGWRWRGIACGQSPYAAVMTAVGEIHNQSDNEPADQSSPIDPSELVHHVAIKNNSQRGNNRHPWSAKRTGLLRIRPA